MPLVLVTGVTGFIATHVTKVLLSNGFHVRGSLRSVAKGDYLKSVLTSPENLSFVVVKDIVADGAFDDAVKGVDYVVHCASPFHFNQTKDVYKELIDPAVRGTTGILESVARFAPSVQRVVITSSVAAVLNPNPKSPEGLTEADWNTPVVEALQRDGQAASPPVAYMASKTLAEQAAWEFMKASPRTFELVVCNPTTVYGPLLQKVDKVEEVNTSCKFVADYITGAVPVVIPVNGGFVDVRDVAYAHYRALVVPAAAGSRFLLSSAGHTHDTLIDVLRKRFPGRPFPARAGVPEALVEVHAHSVKVLGVSYRGFDETINATVDSLLEKGLISV
ncbi:ketoreductase [Zopfochytrium polystomum]|nr:ketoreductase [Zopfochytrium polystomum]